MGCRRAPRTRAWGGVVLPAISGAQGRQPEAGPAPASSWLPRRSGTALLRPGGAPGSWSECGQPRERPGWGCPLSSPHPLLPPGHQQGFLETEIALQLARGLPLTPAPGLASASGGHRFLQEQTSPPLSAFPVPVINHCALNSVTSWTGL